LRNVYGVSVPELRKTAKSLSHLGDDLWTSTTLYVHQRRVVFTEPESLKKREVISMQFIAEIPLEVVTSDARKDILKLNERQSDNIGVIVKKKFVHSSEPVFSGTRITIKSIIEYIEALHSDEDILKQFPDLKLEDLKVARDHWKKDAA
jgi:uncharacterized protein (DUF433 family)